MYYLLAVYIYISIFVICCISMTTYAATLCNCNTMRGVIRQNIEEVNNFSLIF